MIYKQGHPKSRGRVLSGTLTLTLKEGVAESQLVQLLSEYAPVKFDEFLDEVGLARVTVPGQQELAWAEKLKEHDEILDADQECYVQL